MMLFITKAHAKLRSKRHNYLSVFYLLRTGAGGATEAVRVEKAVPCEFALNKQSRLNAMLPIPTGKITSKAFGEPFFLHGKVATSPSFILGLMCLKSKSLNEIVPLFSRLN